MKFTVLAALLAGCVALAATDVCAAVALSARQVSMDGLVDVAVTLTGTADDAARAACTFAATNTATRRSVSIVHLSRGAVETSEDGEKQTIRYVWDAFSDVGKVNIADIALSVKLDTMPGAVRLWEGGPYWADRNLGASRVEDYGYYFTWGDTVGYRREGGEQSETGYTDVTWVSSTGETMEASPFTESACPTFGKTNAELQSEGYSAENGRLVAAHDASAPSRASRRSANRRRRTSRSATARRQPQCPCRSPGLNSTIPARRTTRRARRSTGTKRSRRPGGAELKAIRNLTVRDIANVQGDAIEKLFNTAAELQFQLANKLREIALKPKYQAPKFDGYRQMLEDFSLTCDARGSEILTLYMEVKTFGEAQAIGAGSELANATAANLLKGMAGSMHGNDKTGLFKTEVASIEASLADIAGATTVDTRVLQHLLDKTSQLSANLKKPEVAQTMDPGIHAKLTARLDSLRGELGDRVNRAVEDSVSALYKKAAAVNNNGRLLASFLVRKGKSFPVLKNLMSLLARIEDGGLRDNDDAIALDVCLKSPHLKTEIEKYQDLDDPDKPTFDLSEKPNHPLHERFLKKIGILETTISMVQRVASELRGRRAAWTDNGLGQLSGEDVINALRKNAKLSMVLEARVNGVNEDSLNPQLCDENLVEKKKLGEGAANVVYKMTYRMEDGTTKDFVFKPDLGGRVGFESLLIATNAYASTQQSVKHNTATCDVADLLGLGKLTGKNYATVHDGQYGLLMELAPGTEAANISDSKDISLTRKFADRKIVGSLARELNDLRWLDLATGQGDRHAYNYLVDFGPDKKTPRVTAIDNDLSFTSYLVGVGKFNVNHDSTRMTVFMSCLQAAFDIKRSLRGKMDYEAFVAKLNANNYIVDTKNASKQVLCALCRTFGFKSLTMPNQMSRALHDKLVALTDDQLRSFALRLQRNLDRQDALDATIQRLKDLRQIAEDYEKDGKIVDDEAWVTDKNVLNRELTPDHIGPIKNLVDLDALRTSSSFLKRDFHVAKSLTI